MKTIKWLEWGIFASFILLLVVLGSSLLPTKSIISSYVVSTGSMEPSINTGSLVWTSGRKIYDIGDVIVFPSPQNRDQTIVHRIASLESSSPGSIFTTKGDNNENNDDWVVFEGDVIGKVFVVIPAVGFALEKMRTPFGFVATMALPILYLFVLQVKKIKEGIDEEVKKKTAEELEKFASENITLLLHERFNQSYSLKNKVDESTKGTKSKLGLMVLVTLMSTIFISTDSALALFSANAQVSNLTITTKAPVPEPFRWSGGLDVMNKTNGVYISLSPHSAMSYLGDNVTFRPEVLIPEAHHFTIIIKRMSTDQMILFRTMISRWSMENYRQDGHLGYTFTQVGNYWLQVNAYSANGTPVGYYYSILDVVQPLQAAPDFANSELDATLPDEPESEIEEISEVEDTTELEDEPSDYETSETPKELPPIADEE